MIERRRSRIQGWGVFATEPISKNTRIVHYAGEKIPNRESVKREVRYLKKGHIWCFKLNRLYVRDAAVGGNIARGEELTYDYSTDGVGCIQCRCRPGCETKL